ncbi:cell adhesion molecule Dscam1-like isoform X4 [Scylla paramamosain]|uniref:cell adhesion molecule Dscam1-like isoform X4 n=1 Tax=Scylla paramamosain TaxID=85552 RepID=UPI003083A7CE
MQVLAVNVRGASSPSPTLSITTLQEPPSAPPTHLRAHARQQASISLTWQTPAAHLSPGEVTGYQVGFREASVGGDEGEYRWKSVRGGAMTAKVEGLRHYTAYSVTVRAVNQVGSGPPAQPVTVTTAQGVPSAAPDGIECDPLSSQALRVRWNPLPLNLSNGPVQGYKVFYKRTSNIEGSNAVDVKRTTNLETSLQGLGRYTNYSVRVLAYTGAGDGVVSASIHCATLQDVPGPPAAIRALPAGPHSIVVSWLPPERPNGILEHYTLYYRPLNAHRQALQTVVVPVEGGATASRPAWGEVSREVEGLDAHARYEMWVKASTRVGEGGASRVVSQAPAATVAARIKSFGQAVEVKAGAPLTLPCSVVGHSAPLVTWTHLGRDTIPNSQTLPDHSLHLPAVTSEASGNYTCHAHNPSGRDEAQWSVRVVETPPPPTLRVQYSTETTIHISWHTAGDGGKPITGYIIRYRLEGGEWQEEAVEPGEASHVLQKLRCGSTYHLQVAARNLVGHGKASRTVKTRTRGAAPRQPRHQDLVSVNSSSVTLQLYTWPSGGCPITRWMVEYRAHSENSFTAAASHLAGDTDSYTLGDLAPLTWYQLRVTAYNTAGSTSAAYDVATASLTGATLAPESVVEVVDRLGSPLYLDPHILAPVVSGVACTLALLLCVGLLVSRGRAQFMKGADTNSGSSGGGGGNSNGNTYSRSLAEIQNHHNDSQEQLSPPPGPRSKHDEAYSATSVPFPPSLRVLPSSRPPPLAPLLAPLASPPPRLARQWTSRTRSAPTPPSACPRGPLCLRARRGGAPSTTHYSFTPLATKNVSRASQPRRGPPLPPSWAEGGVMGAADQQQVPPWRSRASPASRLCPSPVCVAACGVQARRRWKRRRRGRPTVGRRVSRTRAAVPEGYEAAQGTRTRCLSGLGEVLTSASTRQTPALRAMTNGPLCPPADHSTFPPPTPSMPLTDSMPVHLLHHLHRA